MKNALKSLKVWIIAGVLTIIGAGVPFLILVITLNIENAAPFQYPLLLGAFAAVYLLVGFIWGDLFLVKYRRKEKNWDGEIPLELKEQAWKRRWPFYIPAIIVFIVFMVFEIIYWCSGGYPLL